MASQAVLNAVPATSSLLWGEIQQPNATVPNLIAEKNTLLLLKIPIYLLLAIPFLLFANKKAGYDDGIPLLNRKFNLEPRLFARIRWAFHAREILDEGYRKAGLRMQHIAWEMTKS